MHARTCACVCTDMHARTRTHLVSIADLDGLIAREKIRHEYKPVFPKRCALLAGQDRVPARHPRPAPRAQSQRRIKRMRQKRVGVRRSVVRGTCTATPGGSAGQWGRALRNKRHPHRNRRTVELLHEVLPD